MEDTRHVFHTSLAPSATPDWMTVSDRLRPRTITAGRMRVSRVSQRVSFETQPESLKSRASESQKSISKSTHEIRPRPRLDRKVPVPQPLPCQHCARIYAHSSATQIRRTHARSDRDQRRAQSDWALFAGHQGERVRLSLRTDPLGSGDPAAHLRRRRATD